LTGIAVLGSIEFESGMLVWRVAGGCQNALDFIKAYDTI